MSNKWLGDAQAVAQVTTLTVAGTVSTNQLFNAQMGNKTVTYKAVASETPTTVATALTALLTASTIAEFGEATYTSSAGVITATASTAGRPFTLTVSTSGGTATFVAATPTASAGPNHFDTAANWSDVVPSDGNSDDVLIADSSVDILYNIPADSPAYNSFTVRNYSGRIGLPDVNIGGYREYRNKTWTLKSPTILIGENVSSPLIRLDMSSQNTAARVLSTGQATSDAVPALLLDGGAAGTSLTIVKGSVGLGLNSATSTTMTTLRIGSETSPATDVQLSIGDGTTTLGTVTQYGGQVVSNAAVTSLTMGTGSWTQYQGAITTLVCYAATVNYLSNSTITTASVLDRRGLLDVAQDQRTRTITTLTLYNGGVLNDPGKTVTFTNAIATDRASVVASDFGDRFNLQRS